METQFDPPLKKKYILSNKQEEAWLQEYSPFFHVHKLGSQNLTTCCRFSLRRNLRPCMRSYVDHMRSCMDHIWASMGQVMITYGMYEIHQLLKLPLANAAKAWFTKLDNLLQVQFAAKSKTIHEIYTPYAIMYGPYLSIYGPSDDHENMHTHTLVHIDLVWPDRSCGARKWGAIRARTLCGRALSLWICLQRYIWKMNIFAKPKDMQNKAA